MNYESLTEAVIQEHNMVRENPKSLIPHLEAMLKCFKGNTYHNPKGGIPLMTNEGPNAIHELIQYLMSAQPLPKLAHNPELSKAALDHVKDIGPRGVCGHSGSDGSNSSRRIERYGEWDGSCGENISFGESTARDIVAQLMIDDGTSNRGHRKNIMNPSYKMVGVACGPHKEYEHLCVIDYVGGFVKKGEQNQHHQHSQPQGFGKPSGFHDFSSFGGKGDFDFNKPFQYEFSSNPQKQTSNFSSSYNFDMKPNPTSHTTNYGGPTSHTTNYGGPTSYSSNYGAPTSHTANYGAPTSHTANYGAPTSHTANYGAPTSHTANYGGPSSYTPSYGGSTSHTSNYGAAPSHTSNYGGPTSYTSNYSTPSYTSNFSDFSSTKPGSQQNAPTVHQEFGKPEVQKYEYNFSSNNKTQSSGDFDDFDKKFKEMQAKFSEWGNFDSKPSAQHTGAGGKPGEPTVVSQSTKSSTIIKNNQKVTKIIKEYTMSDGTKRIEEEERIGQKCKLG